MKTYRDIGVSLRSEQITWHGDNRVFVVEEVLPRMDLSDDVRQVIRWAYGYDGSLTSWEIQSDGSSFVADRFMLGMIKEPPGVAHDYLYGTAQHRTPDGRLWTRLEADLFYFRAEQQFGYGFGTSALRLAGLRVFGWIYWR